MTSIDELRAVPVYTDRKDYETRTGNQAPPADPTRPAQYYDAVGTFKRYTGPTIGGLTPQEPFTALGLNLPGKYKYPVYVPDLTGGTETSLANVGHETYTALFHTSKAEAQALRDEMALDLGESPRTVLTEWDPRQGRAGEIKFNNERRLYKIGDSYAGFLLKLRYAGGVGVPGHWEDTGTGKTGYKFATEAPEKTGAGVTPVPHLDLPSGNIVIETPFGLMLADGGAGTQPGIPAIPGDLSIIVDKLDMLSRKLDQLREILEMRG